MFFIVKFTEMLSFSFGLGGEIDIPVIVKSAGFLGGGGIRIVTTLVSTVFSP